MHSSRRLSTLLYQAWPPSDRYVALTAGLSQPVQCYSGCKNTVPGNVTWCVYIYHPKESIRLCLNNSGVIVETPSAALLGLREILSIQVTKMWVEWCMRLISNLQSCPGSSSSGCLWVTRTPYYFKNAYFVCTTRSASCIRHTFEEIQVQGMGLVLHGSAMRFHVWSLLGVANYSTNVHITNMHALHYVHVL